MILPGYSFSALVTEVQGKAPIDHNHDSLYWRRDEVVPPADHNHDDQYAPIDHNHDGEYADANHNHDTVYWKRTETVNKAKEVEVGPGSESTDWENLVWHEDDKLRDTESRLRVKPSDGSIYSRGDLQAYKRLIGDALYVGNGGGINLGGNGEVTDNYERVYSPNNEVPRATSSKYGTVKMSLSGDTLTITT